MQERITELEIKLAHQDRLLADLDGVVRAFTTRVEELEREVKELRDAIGPPPIGPADETPPHH